MTTNNEKSSTSSTDHSISPSHLISLQGHSVAVKLTDENFLIWKKHITTTLKGYGLEGYLDGSITTPTRLIPAEEEGLLKVNPAYIQWQRQDQLLASWIISSLSESILITVVGLSTSFEIWQCLESNFSSHSTARIMQYKIQLQNFKKNSLSVREYLSKIKGYCDALAAVGHKMNERDQVMHVLAGPGSEYDIVVVSIISKTESCNLRDVTSLLLSYESRLEVAALINTDGSLPTAHLATQTQGRNAQTPQYYKERGGYRGRGRGYRNGRGGRSFGNRIHYQICGYSNHTADKCYNRFNPDFTPKTNSQSQRSFTEGNKNFTQSSAMIATTDQGSEVNWYPDSGATHHITNDFSNLNFAADYNGHGKLQIGNGAGLDISHVGSSHKGNSSQGGS